MIYGFGNHRNFERTPKYKKRTLRSYNVRFQMMRLVSICYTHLFPSAQPSAPGGSDHMEHVFLLQGHHFLGQRWSHPKEEPTHNLRLSQCKLPFGILELRLWETEWVGSKEKRCWHRESSQVMLKGTEKEDMGIPIAEVPGVMPPPAPYWGLGDLPFPGELRSHSVALPTELVNWVSTPFKRSLPKPMVNPTSVHYDKTVLCNSAFTSKPHKKEKFQHNHWVEGVMGDTVREWREGGLYLMGRSVVLHIGRAPVASRQRLTFWL